MGYILILVVISLLLLCITVQTIVDSSKEKISLRIENQKLKDQCSSVNSDSVLSELETLKNQYDQLLLQNEDLRTQNSTVSFQNEQLKQKIFSLENTPEIKVEKDIKKTTFLGLKKLSYKIYNESDFFDSIERLRLQNAFNTDLSIEDLTVSTNIISENEIYKVTLNRCTCPDFTYRRHPCKHMLFLAYSMGILQLNREASERRIESSIETLNQKYVEVENYKTAVLDLKQEKRKLESKIQRTKEVLQNTLKENKEAEKIKNKYLKEIESILQDRCAAYPQLAAIMTELQTLYYERTAAFLLSKPNPAIKEVKRIRELRRDTRKILAEKKELEYKMSYIQKMFPNINDIFDTGFVDEGFELETYETTDRVRSFLSHEEFKALSTTEKNQLALERYVSNRKSKWQIGRDYEMYIGQLCEKRGYKVQYTGIIKNLEDMGRDLIITNGSDTRIIQCKNWSKEKTIHEKHIFQLFGTIVLYNIDHPAAHATGIFVSTTRLSDKAAQIAKELGILVYQEDLGVFPRIKCNINPSTGERIYHLPFDQQYDTTVIEENMGECYAYTVQEAEMKGFRRAFKHIA